MRAFACVTLVLVACGSAPAIDPATPATTTPPVKRTVAEFRICRANGSIGPGPWEPAIAQFVGWAAGFAKAFDEVKVAFASCLRTPATCYAEADSGLVYCSTAMFERLMKSVAALAVIYGQSTSSRYVDLAGDHRRGPASDAFQFGMTSTGPSEFLARVDALRRIDALAVLRSGSSDRTSVLYAELGALVFQYIVGHELTHANHETCAVVDKADVEVSGLLDKLAALDTGQALFCGNELSKTELHADRCALRQIRSGVAYLRSHLPVNGSELALRGSAALLSWYAFSGYIDQPTAPRVAALVLRGYLRGPLRGLLASAELAVGLPGPRVCGEAARIFTNGVQEHFNVCKSDHADPGGDVPDLILRLLPAGVERGWATNQWDSNSFACDGAPGGPP